MPIIQVEEKQYYRLAPSASDFLEIYTDGVDMRLYPVEMYDHVSTKTPHTEWHLGGPLYSLRLV